MKIPEWLKTTASIIVIGFVLVTPFVFGFDKKETAPFFAPIFSREVTIGESHLWVAYADTNNSREQGLSYTKKLDNDQGMLFVFEDESHPSFWMKDMNYPLDIIWIDKDKKVVEISKNIDPVTYPEKFYSVLPIKYVLEVNSGFSDLNNIKVGSELSF